MSAKSTKRKGSTGAPKRRTRQLLDEIQTRLEAIESRAPKILGGKTDSREDILDKDPHSVDKILAKLRKKFADVEANHFSIKTDESGLLSTLKGALDDHTRLARSLAAVVAALEDDDAIDPDIVVTLHSTAMLAHAAAAKIRLKLWQKVGEHAAPSIPKEIRTRELAAHWPADLMGFTAQLQEQELAACHVLAMQKLARVQPRTTSRTRSASSAGSEKGSNPTPAARQPSRPYHKKASPLEDDGARRG